MQEKITAEEIELLRQEAEEEKKVLLQIKDYFKKVYYREDGLYPLKDEIEILIMNRGAQEEIKRLFELYHEFNQKASVSNVYKEITVSDEAQEIFCQKHARVMRNLFEFLSANLKLSLCAEILILKLGMEIRQQLSPKAEKMLLENVFASSSLQSTFGGVGKINHFSWSMDDENEAWFITNFLRKAQEREPLISEALVKCVAEYVSRVPHLSLAGEKALIASGNHEIIMQYLQRLEDEPLMAVDELLERGNREEITLYYKAYPRLSTKF